MSNIRPQAITANRNENFLSIEWTDGHASIYPFYLLRYACPCAECRGGHANMRSKPDPAVFDLPPDDSLKSQLRKIEAVGSYAITIEWEDGHHFGIYTWQYLRDLCLCSECRSENT
jgi:DUF971 family protein